MIDLEPANRDQEDLRARILDDLDLVAKFRTTRLSAAGTQPPLYLYVIFIGFLITMVDFGVYKPQVPMVALISLYTAFIGLVLYLILVLSYPFRGSIIIEPTPFENLAATLILLNQ